MNWKARSYQPELLDAGDIPFDHIRQNMHELDIINTLLGGHRITLRGFNRLRKKKKRLHVCEVGCGGGDNLLAIWRWCKKRQIDIRFTGIDMKPACIAYAQTKAALQPITTWITSDYRAVHFDEKPDMLFTSLFCHHFTDEELVGQLQWMAQQADLGFFINDLHRHPLAYHSIKLLTRLFSVSYLVKHDAPLSVQRGFVRSDWQRIFTQAGLPGFSLEWQWAFRHLITYQHG